MKIAITGAAGFLGRHAVDYFERRGHEVLGLTRADDASAWDKAFVGVDAVLHLAGSNRPLDDNEFEQVNVGLTRMITSHCDALDLRPKIVFTSTTQAGGQSRYGVSKRQAEEALSAWAERSGGEAVIFRLPNLFGKWGRPHYNSVVATWCYCIARGIPYEISDRARVLTLMHVDDTLTALARELDEKPQPGSWRFAPAEPVSNISLEDLSRLLELFRESRRSGLVPDLTDHFTAKLQSTYTSYLPQGGLAYDLERRSDARGVLAEFLKSPAIGQIFVSRSNPGVIRGDHFHHSKVEKFLVLEGEAIVRFRDLSTGATESYPVSGTDLRVIDIPPGRTHNIENVGARELVVLFWASEIFDPARSDTFAARVFSVADEVNTSERRNG